MNSLKNISNNYTGSHNSTNKSILLQFTNCRILKNHKIIKEDLWVRNGKIVNPESIFFEEKILSDCKLDCGNAIIAPGFIELQINGGFGIDFSHDGDIDKGINIISKKILKQGVTSFCPTIVTSPKSIYTKVIPQIKRRKGNKNGATILGIHLEGPFINKNKKGAHPPEFIKDFNGKGAESLKDTYGTLEDVAIITLAPEIQGSCEVMTELNKLGITISLGHSDGNLSDGEKAVKCGAKLITHLFNAMLPFHHRDPGLVGLLTSDQIPNGKEIFFGIISDGVHTHPAALRIAYRSHPNGLILVTDAISAMGLPEGKHHLGQNVIEVRNQKAYIAGTNTLCGSIATMDECIRIFQKATNCTKEYALEAASLHPAQCLGISSFKGTLNYGSDADFVFVDDNLNLLSTWIAGECVYNECITDKYEKNSV